MSIPNDGMTDERWAIEAAKIDGWSPGRVRLNNGALDFEPAFGWLRGSFGIFEGNCETNIGAIQASSLTHIKTGLRVALFNSPEYAATAALLAERVGDWAELKADGVKTPKWRAAAKKMYALWRDAALIDGVVCNSEGKSIWCGGEPISSADAAALSSHQRANQGE